MEYERFARLMVLNMELNRGLHYATPTQKLKLRKTLDAMNERLHIDPDYNNHMKRYIKEGGRIG